MCTKSIKPPPRSPSSFPPSFFLVRRVGLIVFNRGRTATYVHGFDDADDAERQATEDGDQNGEDQVVVGLDASVADYDRGGRGGLQREEMMDRRFELINLLEALIFM